MNELYAQGRIKFGERYTIYSPKDDQPCMDHDRQSGEGVGPQEYTAIKMEVLEWNEAVPQSVKDAVKGKKVSFVAGTLRPETMYGQTNCFVGTGITYGVYQASDNEAYVVSERSARNMAYQGIFEERGKLVKLAEVTGQELVGSKVSPPFGFHKEVYVLPMEGVLATKVRTLILVFAKSSADSRSTYRGPPLSRVYHRTRRTTMRLLQTFARSPNTTRSNRSGSQPRSSPSSRPRSTAT